MTFEILKKIGDYWGYLTSLIVFVGALYAIYLYARGIAPVLFRLGNGLSKRKIAIFAKGNVAGSLEDLLKDSKLFRHTNLIVVQHDGDIGRAEAASVFLVYWPDWMQSIDRILTQKKDQTAMILYAPPGNPVPPEVMARINDLRNTTLVNLRGRLMNDVVLSMITTSYDKHGT
jgi:hypothetical protein